MSTRSIGVAGQVAGRADYDWHADLLQEIDAWPTNPYVAGSVACATGTGQGQINYQSSAGANFNLGVGISSGQFVVHTGS